MPPLSGTQIAALAASAVVVAVGLSSLAHSYGLLPRARAGGGAKAVAEFSRQLASAMEGNMVAQLCARRRGGGEARREEQCAARRALNPSELALENNAINDVLSRKF